MPQISEILVSVTLLSYGKAAKCRAGSLAGPSRGSYRLPAFVTVFFLDFPHFGCTSGCTLLHTSSVRYSTGAHDFSMERSLGVFRKETLMILS